MSDPSGFLVLERQPDYVRDSDNPGYRGLYRLPPFSQELLAQGFEDPAVFHHDRYYDGDLIRTLPLAIEVLRQYREGYPDIPMEIVFTRSWDSHSPAPLPELPAGRLELLGFDVASGSPFMTTVGDMPTEAEAEFRQYLNDSGLFPGESIAEDYRRAYLAKWEEHPGMVRHIWEVFAVEGLPLTPNADLEGSDELLGYRGGPELHDGKIASVSSFGTTLTVLVTTIEGREVGLKFLDVQRIKQHQPVGMQLYALAEMAGTHPWRRFVFVNWDEEDEARLEVISKGFESEPA